MSSEVALIPTERSEVSLGTLHAESASALVTAAAQMATALADVVEQRKLYSTISGRRHVRVEGWTTLAVMLGCTPREVSNVATEDGSYIATVELVRMRDGAVIARATSECGMDEPTWASRARYARRSMAATRATGKACRLAFSWIMALAGYEGTPAEEMPEERDVTPPPRRSEETPKPTAATAFPIGRDRAAALMAECTARSAALGREGIEVHGHRIAQHCINALGLEPFAANAKQSEKVAHLANVLTETTAKSFSAGVAAYKPEKGEEPPF